jgi:hypothetical protein
MKTHAPSLDPEGEATSTVRLPEPVGRGHGIGGTLPLARMCLLADP